jgi:hypothetical protein
LFGSGFLFAVRLEVFVVSLWIVFCRKPSMAHDKIDFRATKGSKSRLLHIFASLCADTLLVCRLKGPVCGNSIVPVEFLQ